MRAAAAHLVLAALGCTHDHAIIVRGPDDLAPVMRPERVDLELVAGPVEQGALLSVADGSVLFRSRVHLMPRRIDLSEIRSVAYQNPRRGALTGLVWGGVGAAISGVLLGMVGSDKGGECSIDCTPRQRAVLYGLIGLGLGAGVGATVGYLGGGRERYGLVLASPP